MSVFATNRLIDLAQLAVELGETDVPASLSMIDDGTTRTIECHDDTITQEALEAAVDAHTPRVDPAPGDRAAAVTAVAAMIVGDKIAADTLSYAEAVAVAPVFPPWALGEDVPVGALRYFDGHLVECIQAHTTQADWTPDATPSLWRVYRDPDAVAEWVQPVGATDAYAKDAKVTHGGHVWISGVAANVWEPGVYGWTQVAT